MTEPEPGGTKNKTARASNDSPAGYLQKVLADWGVEDD